MRRGAFAAAAVLAALIVPADAAAKTISELKLCGPSGCTPVTDPAVIRAWTDGQLAPVAPPPLGPFYRLDVVVTAAPGEKLGTDGSTSLTWSEWYVPRAGTGLVRGTDEAGAASWVPVARSVSAALAAVARGADPYPRPTITAASVGGRAVADPASYARLLDPSWKPAAVWPGPRWQRVRLHSPAPSPWTDGKNVLLYARRRRLLSRDGRVVRVPASVAAAVSSRRSLAGRAGARIEPAAAGLGAAMLVVALAVYRRRGAAGTRRPRGV